MDGELELQQVREGVARKIVRETSQFRKSHERVRDISRVVMKIVAME